jgi:hypothetical protein
MKDVIGIFWPVNRKNYFFWPLLVLIPLMVSDVVTTTVALMQGYQELNPILQNLVQDPALSLVFKLTVPLLLLLLCIFIYFTEKRYGKECPPSSRKLLEVSKFSIFFILVVDCIVYLNTVFHNIGLITG